MQLPLLLADGKRRRPLLTDWKRRRRPLLADWKRRRTPLPALLLVLWYAPLLCSIYDVHDVLYAPAQLFRCRCAPCSPLFSILFRCLIVASIV
jgi:hypothetical protein